MSYFLPEGYVENPNPEWWDDTPYTDEWQREVYLMAYGIALATGAKSILDVGCGSAWKLVNYFNPALFATTGTDSGPTLDWLRATYPERSWSRIEDIVSQKFDLVICADVIEHALDPDALCAALRRTSKKLIMISTPDRLRDAASAMGPPSNLCHVREWSYEEFALYMAQQFSPLGMIVTNAVQTTFVAVVNSGPQAALS